MKFGMVELAAGTIYEISDNWEEAKEIIENTKVSRWNNPVLVVLTDEEAKRLRKHLDVDFNYEKLNIDDWEKFLCDRVVAVPQSGFGYGAQYMEVVNRNRRKFGLEGRFKPTAKTLEVIKRRMKLSGFTPKEIEKHLKTLRRGQ